MYYLYVCSIFWTFGCWCFTAVVIGRALVCACDAMTTDKPWPTTHVWDAMITDKPWPTYTCMGRHDDRQAMNHIYNNLTTTTVPLTWVQFFGKKSRNGVFAWYGEVTILCVCMIQRVYCKSVCLHDTANMLQVCVFAWYSESTASLCVCMIQRIVGALLQRRLVCSSIRIGWIGDMERLCSCVLQRVIEVLCYWVGRAKKNAIQFCRSK